VITRVKELGVRMTDAEKERETYEKQMDQIKTQREYEALDKQIKDIVGSVDAEAAAKGDTIVASRLAGDLGLTSDQLMAQRTRYASGWGELMVAHSLLGGARTDMTIDELYLLRSEGLGWGQIAHGMGLELGPTMAALNAEGRVAKGLAEPDGKPEKIAAAEGGASSAPASAATSAEPKSGAGKSEPSGGATKNTAPKGSESKGQSGKSKSKW